MIILQNKPYHRTLVFKTTLPTPCYIFKYTLPSLELVWKLKSLSGFEFEDKISLIFLSIPGNLRGDLSF